MKFEELGLVEEVMEGVRAMNFKECTPIQEQTIPYIMQGRDLLASAQTGTGKTAAYLLPLLNNLSKGNHAEDKVNAIIMAPTRELAMQIDRLMEGFSYFLSISSVPIYGGGDGASFAQQKRGLELGGDVVIATPGRLLSHLRLGGVDFSGVNYFILDEADRMLDMGFFDDIMEVISYIPESRQTILFSATFPDKIEKLAQKILKNPAEVKISVSKPAEGINQRAYVCHEPQKAELITNVLKRHSPTDKCIVFSSSKDKVKELFKMLRRKGYSCEQMHSDLEQQEREAVMLDFKNGKIQIIIATDILSRGIDIDDITLVVNYDVPHQEEDYVHRVGRTARAGTTGEAITFISERDQHRFSQIERFIEKEIEKLPMPEELGEGPEYKPKEMMRAYGAHSRGKGKFRGGNSQRNSSHHGAKPEEKSAASSQENSPAGNKNKHRRKKPNYSKAREVKQSSQDS